MFVGIDGRSGSGKSTLAAAVRADLGRPGGGDEIDVTVIEGDSFYEGGSAERWDLRTAAEKADQVIDWRRQRAVLDELRASGVAEWYPFDWYAENWDGDLAPLVATPVVGPPPRITTSVRSCRPIAFSWFSARIDLRVAGVPSITPSRAAK